MSDISVNVTNAGAANVSVSSASTVNTTVGNGGAVNVSLGAISPGDATVVSGTVQVGKVTTLAPGSSVTINNSGTAFSAVLDFGIPGATADASTLSSGIVPDARLGSNIPRLVNNLVQAVNLPSYVDDVIDVGGTLPESGDTGKIYVVSTGTNVNKIYRWSGSTFIEISPSPGTTDAVPEGSANLYHTTKRAADAAPVQSVAGRTGAVTLTAADVSGVVTGVNDITGKVTLAAGNNVSLATSGSTVTISSAGAPVQSVAGRTGTISLTAADVSGVVSGVNSVTGAVKIAAGSNVTVTSSGSTITIGATAAGIGPNDSVDGGFFTGNLVRVITITSQPVDVTMSSGAATFTVVATVAPSTALAYQWQRSNDSGVTWANVAGATASSLALTGLTGGDGLSRFRVVVSAAAAASVTSAVAVLYSPVSAGSNSGNYNNVAVWGGEPRPTSVGTNGGPSAYGTYDQSGNVSEWNDLDGSAAAQKAVAGGSFSAQAGAYSATRQLLSPDSIGLGIGFRVATATNPDSLAGFVAVGDPGNAADSNGYGSVAYTYMIGRHEVTVNEYAEFLSAVGAFGLTNLGYAPSIVRSGTAGNYSYAPSANMGSKPMALSWLSAARYCNWLHNGKPQGAQSSSTTEAGAYAINGASSGTAPAKAAGARYYIATENEWYKAAYYKSGGVNAGYWAYATQADAAPTPVTATSTGDGVLP